MAARLVGLVRGIWPRRGAGREGGEAVLRSLLIALGVDLAVVVAAVIVFGRSRWLRRGVKRPGAKPVVIELTSGIARIGVAARAGYRALVAGPLAIDVTSALFRAAPAAPRTR
jgi:hypothetical protein